MLFVALVPVSCRQLFYRWYRSTFHFLSSSPPLHLSPLFFLFVMFACAMYTHGFWCVGLYMWSSNKFIIITAKSNAEQRGIHSLVSCVCSVFVYLSAQRPLTRWVGFLWAIKRISVRRWNEPRASQHSVIKQRVFSAHWDTYRVYRKDTPHVVSGINRNKEKHIGVKVSSPQIKMYIYFSYL